MRDIIDHNRRAWDKQSVDQESRWVQPVDRQTIELARSGEWEIYLTPNLAVPLDWFGDLEGKHVLCLASGGGQQAPILAAAGARVTSYDLSEEQLARDRSVAIRDKLDLITVQGEMADLSELTDNTFDLIFHPVSNVFTPDLKPVWRECARVLHREGRLLSGFMNPDFFIFDHWAIEKGAAVHPVYKLPYADAVDMQPERLKAVTDQGVALEHSHSLEAQIAGQIKAGFVISGFYEDWWADEATPLNKFMPTTFATLAVKNA